MNQPFINVEIEEPKKKLIDCRFFCNSCMADLDIADCFIKQNNIVCEECLE